MKFLIPNNFSLLCPILVSSCVRFSIISVPLCQNLVSSLTYCNMIKLLQIILLVTFASYFYPPLATNLDTLYMHIFWLNLFKLRKYPIILCHPPVFLQLSMFFSTNILSGIVQHYSVYYFRKIATVSNFRLVCKWLS